MNVRMKIAFACYLAAAVLLLGFGLLYSLRGEFMPYHADAVGMPWSDVPTPFPGCHPGIDESLRNNRGRLRLRPLLDATRLLPPGGTLGSVGDSHRRTHSAWRFSLRYEPCRCEFTCKSAILGRHHRRHFDCWRLRPVDHSCSSCRRRHLELACRRQVYRVGHFPPASGGFAR